MFSWAGSEESNRVFLELDLVEIIGGVRYVVEDVTDTFGGPVLRLWKSQPEGLKK